MEFWGGMRKCLTPTLQWVFNALWALEQELFSEDKSMTLSAKRKRPPDHQYERYGDTVSQKAVRSCVLPPLQTSVRQFCTYYTPNSPN